MIEPSLKADLAGILRDPYRFLQRLKIADEQGIERVFDTPHPEQIDLLDAFVRHPKVFVLKARQIGCGTVRQACDFHYGYTCPDTINTLVVAHEKGAMNRHAGRTRKFYETLPGRLKRETYTANKTELSFRSRDGSEGSAFVAITAGGKSEGASYTFQRLHLTEMAKWDADAQAVYGSVTATLHPGPHASLCVESTSEGPLGFFPALASIAQRSPDWLFCFYPWTMHPTYAREVSAKFADTLTEEENRLLRQSVKAKMASGERVLPPPTLGQIAWRRAKIEEIGPARFRYEYPLTVEEAFASGGTSFFPADVLTPWLFTSAPEQIGKRIYDAPRPDCQYAVGVDVGQGLGTDASGGKEGDYSVICVVDHRGDQVACWSDNKTPPHVVGELAVEMAVRYNHALLLIEGNGPGIMALQRAGQLGYGKMWRDRKGKDFTTWGNQNSAAAGQGKHEVFGHARKKLLQRMCKVQDRLTLQELLNIREDARGRIGGADKKHDDHAMAWVLAMWAARRVEGFEADAQAEVTRRFGLDRPRLRSTVAY